MELMYDSKFDETASYATSEVAVDSSIQWRKDIAQWISRHESQTRLKELPAYGEVRNDSKLTRAFLKTKGISNEL